MSRLGPFRRNPVGRIAAKADVKTLVLSHFVPGGYPFLKDEVWFDAVRPYFSGNLVVGHDLLALQLMSPRREIFRVRPESDPAQIRRF